MCWHQFCPLTYRSTCPAERSRMWEDTDRGRPFLSQLSCGGGDPLATHSMLTELSSTVVSCSVVSLLPSITGGTEKVAKWQIEKQQKIKSNSLSRVVNLPYTLTLNILSSSPAGLLATQVYLPLSEVWASFKVNVLLSGLKLKATTESHQKQSWSSLAEKKCTLSSSMFYFTAYELPEVCADGVIDDLAVLQPLDGRRRGSSGFTDQLDAFVQEDSHLTGKLWARDTGRD